MTVKMIDATALPLAEAAALLKKPDFDQVELSAAVKDGIKAVFGEELSARQVVERIVADVRRGGDVEVARYTGLIDRVELPAGALQVTEKEFAAAFKKADEVTVAALEKAISNVKSFHAEQLPKTWLTGREHGSLLGQKATPLDRVGIYVPGGTAAYPSSVVMNAVPAKVAGVGEIVMCVPPGKGGEVNPYVLIAAKKTGVDKVFKVGGAQAIAAMAFGTESIPRVDKITGPGNIFVTLAKKEVYGYCDIDMLAGPSEILIIADSMANPSYLAADLLSQAEHDSLASAVLVTDSKPLALQVDRELNAQLAKLPRQDMARQALDKQGMIIVTKNMDEAVALANAAAPEHLEIMTGQPFSLLPKIKHAGAIFLGEYSPEPLGDYWAGPNHVLPTGGTARFYSVLNVETFMKKSSIIAYTQQALKDAAADVIRLAEAEGLDAHANSVRLRIGGQFPRGQS